MGIWRIFFIFGIFILHASVSAQESEKSYRQFISVYPSEISCKVYKSPSDFSEFNSFAGVLLFTIEDECGYVFPSSDLERINQKQIECDKIKEEAIRQKKTIDIEVEVPEKFVSKNVRDYKTLKFFLGVSFDDRRFGMTRTSDESLVKSKPAFSVFDYQ